MIEKYEFVRSGRKVMVVLETLANHDGLLGFYNVSVMDIRRGHLPVRSYRHIFYTSEIRLGRFWAHDQTHPNRSI